MAEKNHDDCTNYKAPGGTLNGEYKKINDIAENALVKFVSRGLLIIVIPIAGWFASSSYDLIKEQGKILQKVVTTQTELKTMLEKGVEPRVGFLEDRVQTMEVELRARTADRFTKIDARDLKDDIIKRIERLEKGITR